MPDQREGDGDLCSDVEWPKGRHTGDDQRNAQILNGSDAFVEEPPGPADNSNKRKCRNREGAV
jgi:hypothetical protein